MVLLCSIASGNASSASTWGVTDATSFLNTETALTVTTAYVVPSGGGLTTPGAIPVSHLLLKLASRAGTTGTFRAAIYSATGTSGTADAAITSTNTTLTDTRAAWATDEFVGATVTCNAKTMVVTSNTGTVLTGASWSGGSNPGNGNAWSMNVVQGTSVVINCADFPVAAQSDFNGGWHLFKLAAPVTLLAATQYGVMALTSSGSQINLFGTATSNLSRGLVTTTTQAPTTDDVMITAGEKTGAGTGNSFTITWDFTTTTDFGGAPTAANALIHPGLAICHMGTVAVGTTAATQYYMKMSNCVIIYSGGTFTAGTSGTPIPSGSSFTLHFDCGANVDYGLLNRNLGTREWRGYDRFTSSPNQNHFTLLTADSAVGATSFSVLDTTGWEVGDEVCISSTTNTATQNDYLKIKTIPNSTSFTVYPVGDAQTLSVGGTAAAALYAHDGNTTNGDIRAEVGNLTRNIKVRGASGSLQAFIVISSTASDTCRNVETYWMGSGTGSKRGVDTGTTTGVCDWQYCVNHDFVATSSVGFNILGTSGSGVTFSNNVIYFCNSAGLVSVASTGTWIISNNMFCKTTGGTNPVVSLLDVGGTLTGNHISGGSSGGLQLNEVASASASVGTIGTFSDNVVHSSTGSPGAYLLGMLNGTISNLRVWRINGQGIVFLHAKAPHPGLLTLIDLVAFGNVTCNLTIDLAKVRLVNPSIYAGTTVVAPYGILLRTFSSALGSYLAEVEIEGGSIGSPSTHASGDIALNNYSAPRIIMHGTTLGSTITVASPSSMDRDGFICGLKINGTAGNHKTWKTGGRTSGASICPDSTLYKTAAPSIQMWPGSASRKLESSTFEVAVASGGNLTPSIWIRTSLASTGDSATLAGHAVPSGLPRLMVRRNYAAGITDDTQIAIATSAASGAWEEVTGSLSGAGITIGDDAVLEFYVDCEGTAGFVNIDDFTVTGGADPSGLKFWSPRHAGALSYPASGGGGSTVIVIED